MSFLRRMSGLRHQEELGIEPFFTLKEPAELVWASNQDASYGGVPGTFKWEETTGSPRTH